MSIKEEQRPSEIVRLWRDCDLASDFKQLLQNPYTWITNELKKSEGRRRYGPSVEQYDVLMEILDIMNSIYSPDENHSH